MRRNKQLLNLLKISLCFLSAFSFYACSFFNANDVDKISEKKAEESQSDSQASSEDGYFTLEVPVNFGNENLSGRSAYPYFADLTLDNTNYTYTATSTAFKESDTTGSFSSNKITYTIKSHAFTNTAVTFYIKDTSSNILWYGTAKVTYTLGGTANVANTVYFQRYSSSTVKGDVSLELLASSGNKIYCEITDSEGNSVSEIAVTSNLNKCAIKKADSAEGVTPGTYIAKISIYAQSDTEKVNCLDYIIQTIEIWPKLTTNKWYLSDGTVNQVYRITQSSDNVKLYVRGFSPTGIYADPDFSSASAATGNSGTIMHPLPTLQEALAKCINSSKNYTIIIDGTLNGTSSTDTTTIGSSIRAASLTITGSTSSAEIIRYSDTMSSARENGSVITINASDNNFPVTITNLKLSNGYGVKGGGIYLIKGQLTLGDGVKICGNKATNGGGVYVESNGSLYMKGSSLIGYDVTTNQRPLDNTLGTTSEKAANIASENGGGIYNNEGNVYIGCNDTGATTGYALSEGYGIRQNSVSGGGGGIYSTGGNLIVASGVVSFNTGFNNSGGAIYCKSYNTCKILGGIIEGNKALDGGAISIYSLNTTAYISNVTVKNNSSDECGGALCLSGSTIVQISGDTTSFTGNNANINGDSDLGGGFAYVPTGNTLNITSGNITGNSAGGGQGGAIFIDGGTVTMSGGTIGGDGVQNTVNNSGIGGAIYQEGTFTISGTASIASGSEHINDVYVTSGHPITIGTFSDTVFKATITPYDWKRDGSVQVLSASAALSNDVLQLFGITDSDFKVIAKSGETTKGVIDATDIVVASTAADDTTRVSDSYPGLTSGARGTKLKPYASIAAAMELLDANHNTIKINGTLTERQTVGTTSGITKLIIQGMNTSSGINANLSNPTSNGSALTINCTVPVDLKNLIIQKGNTLTSGGGIYAAPLSGTTYATITLLNNVVIQQNHADGKGGGIYTKGVLNIQGSGVSIQSNTTDGNGGGVYACKYVTMSNGTISSNEALNGGGVYTEDSMVVSGTNCLISSNTANATIAGNGGGGVYAKTGFSMTGGSFSGNKALSANGGGVNCEAGLISITGSSLFYSSNKANYGGSIYVAERMEIGGGVNITPYVIGQGDICFDDGATLTIVSELTLNGIAASITQGDSSTEMYHNFTPSPVKRGASLTDEEFASSLAKIFVTDSYFDINSDLLYEISFEKISSADKISGFPGADFRGITSPGAFYQTDVVGRSQLIKTRQGNYAVLTMYPTWNEWNLTLLLKWKIFKSDGATEYSKTLNFDLTVSNNTNPEIYLDLDTNTVSSSNPLTNAWTDDTDLRFEPSYKERIDLRNIAADGSSITTKIYYVP